MDIKKTFIKVFDSKTTIFGRSDAAGSSKAIGGLANNNKKFIDLISLANIELGLLNSTGTADIKEKIEIPNTAFASITNPTIEEVRVWVDINLTPKQKANSELFMIEQLSDWNGATFTTLGSTEEQPDYVWSITHDNITELHRRVNNGNIWYVSTIASPTYLAQKGNPDRPFTTLDAVQPYLTDGDEIYVFKGDYISTPSYTKGNVYYTFEDGSTLTPNDGQSAIWSLDGESISVVGGVTLTGQVMTVADTLTVGGTLNFTLNVDELITSQATIFQMVIESGVTKSNLYLKAKRVNMTDGGSLTWHKAMETSWSIEIDNVYINGDKGVLWTGSGSALGYINNTYKFKIGKLVREQSSTAVSSWSLFPVITSGTVATDNVSLHVDIDYIEIHQDFLATAIFNHTSDGNRAWVNSDIEFNIKKLICTASATRTEGSSLGYNNLFGIGTFSQFDNSRLAINIGDCEITGDCHLITYEARGVGATDSNIEVHVDDCRSTSLTHCIIKASSVVTVSNTLFKISGNYETPLPVLINYSTSNFIKLDTLRSLCDAVNISTEGRILIKNSELKTNNTAVELITSTTPNTPVTTIGSITNNANIAGAGSNIVLTGTFIVDTNLA